MKQLSEEQAKAFFDSQAWDCLSDRERAMFQIEQDRLCMPFTVFHRAVEKALGRPVWTHEFGLNREGLRQELLGAGEAPTMQEIIDLIPEQKRIIVIEP